MGGNNEELAPTLQLSKKLQAGTCLAGRALWSGVDFSTVNFRHGITASFIFEILLKTQVKMVFQNINKQSPYYPLSTWKCIKLISPLHIRFVQRDKRLNKFFPLFKKIVRNARAYSKSTKRSKSVKSVNILKLLDVIIPLEYFGTQIHRKLFYEIVKLILTSSVHECIYIKQIIKGFDLRKIPWLKEIFNMNIVNSKQLCRRYFYEGQLWLLNKIVKPLILRFYSIVKRGQTHEIELVPKSIWVSFQDKVANRLKNMKYLVVVPEALPNKQPRGVLQIRPKGGYYDCNDFRPILKLSPKKFVRYNVKKNIKEQRRQINRILCSAAKRMCWTKTTNLYSNWKDYVCRLKVEKIYGVKVDVKDAFGNVDIDTLYYVLEIQCVNKQIPETLKDLIIRHIKGQYVAFGKTAVGSPKLWQWKHGLLQGDSYSSALCQLYMSYLDAMHLKDFCKPNAFLHRTVDDYFFCSSDPKEVERFIEVTTSVYNLNTNKTESNLPNYDHNEIAYCGQRFVMKTKEVKGLYSFQKRTEIRHRFKLWNIQKPIYPKQQEQISLKKFLKTPMLFKSNNYHFKNMEINTVFNREETVMQNHFEAMILLAFKFDAAFMAVRCIIKDYSLATYIIQKTVHKYAKKTVDNLEKNKGHYFTGLLSFEALLKIGIQAFILVLKKRQLYREYQILDALLKQMKKTNSKIVNYQELHFENFKCMPKFFNNISIQRRLPHHKVYNKLKL